LILNNKNMTIPNEWSQEVTELKTNYSVETDDELLLELLKKEVLAIRVKIVSGELAEQQEQERQEQIQEIIDNI
tara:strand:+ start:382 stop:603 length:222 start_codon:yes stop_codon:yes gene_type:complete